MSIQQKALIVSTDGQHHKGLDQLNVELRRGWRVVQTAPMGGAGTSARKDARLALATLVVLERRDDADEATLAMKEAEEEVDELLDEDLLDEIEENDEPTRLPPGDGDPTPPLN